MTSNFERLEFFNNKRYNGYSLYLSNDEFNDELTCRITKKGKLTINLKRYYNDSDDIDHFVVNDYIERSLEFAFNMTRGCFESYINENIILLTNKIYSGLILT